MIPRARLQGDMETLWMSPGEREEMEANLRLISRKIAKANFLLRTMRARWDLFREKHRHLAHLVQDRRELFDVVKCVFPQEVLRGPDPVYDTAIRACVRALPLAAQTLQLRRCVYWLLVHIGSSRTSH